MIYKNIIAILVLGQVCMLCTCEKGDEFNEILKAPGTVKQLEKLTEQVEILTEKVGRLDREMYIMQNMVLNNGCPRNMTVSYGKNKYYMAYTNLLDQNDVFDVCGRFGNNVKLVAIESQGEQDFLAELSDETECDFVWTSGVASQSGNNDRWTWRQSNGNMDVSHTSWGEGEPNNYQGYSEDAIVLDGRMSWNWNDVPVDLSSDSWYYSQNLCYVCECSPW